jgi:hypothetical protein
MNGWQRLDAQMATFQDRLINAVKLSPQVSTKLATSIAGDIRFLSAQQKQEIQNSSPVPIGDRLSELRAFQDWMDFAHDAVRDKPYLSRAQVLIQNYICFVYLPEGCFRAIAKVCPRDSVAKRCARFLDDHPVRAFRNAIAHANWKYRSDFGAIIFWSRKFSNSDDPLTEFEVEHREIDFWQALSRCVAYSAYSNL